MSKPGARKYATATTWVTVVIGVIDVICYILKDTTRTCKSSTARAAVDATVAYVAVPMSVFFNWRKRVGLKWRVHLRYKLRGVVRSDLRVHLRNEWKVSF